MADSGDGRDGNTPARPGSGARMVTIRVTLPESLHRDLSKLAASNDRSLSAESRIAIRDRINVLEYARRAA